MEDIVRAFENNAEFYEVPEPKFNWQKFKLGRAADSYPPSLSPPNLAINYCTTCGMSYKGYSFTDKLDHAVQLCSRGVEMFCGYCGESYSDYTEHSTTCQPG